MLQVRRHFLWLRITWFPWAWSVILSWWRDFGPSQITCGRSASAHEGIRSILPLPLLAFCDWFLMLAVNIPMSAINTASTIPLLVWSGSSAVLPRSLVGGMMAVDMGDPVNKSSLCIWQGTLASTVSTGGSSSYGSWYGSACSICCNLLSKINLLLKNDLAWTNIVMGLSFIRRCDSFGAADPSPVQFRALSVGSALTGALVIHLASNLHGLHGASS